MLLSMKSMVPNGATSPAIWKEPEHPSSTQLTIDISIQLQVGSYRHETSSNKRRKNLNGLKTYLHKTTIESHLQKYFFHDIKKKYCHGKNILYTKFLKKCRFCPYKMDKRHKTTLYKIFFIKYFVKNSKIVCIRRP